jgi:hypothetical protein
LRNIAVIEGVPSLFGDLPLSMAQRHKDYVYHEEYCFDKDFKKICFENKNLDDPIYGAVCFIMRKGMNSPESFSFTRADADRAGLIKRAKQGMPWQSYPQVMFIRRARSMALKSKFTDATCGASIAEYDFHRAPDMEDLRDVSEPEGPKTVSDLLKEE